MIELGRNNTEVGDALLLNVKTSGQEGISWKYWISAPTMETPTVLKSDSRNACLAFRAVLRCVSDHNEECEKDGLNDPILSVGLPGQV